MSQFKDITYNVTDYLDEIYLAEWKEILLLNISEGVKWLRVIFYVVMVVLFVAGVVGNVLTCVVISCHKSMHTATNYYLFNMAVSDLLVAFGILMELNRCYSYQSNSDFGDVVCKIYFFLVGTFYNNSVLTMTALAIERFIVIWHPLFFHKEHERRRVMWIIVVIWAVAIIEAVPEIFTVNLIQTHRFSVCFIVPTPFAKQVNGVLGLVTFIIPLGIMILMYTMIAFKVNDAQSSCNYSGSHVFNHRNSSSKVNKLTMALTASFTLCWLPFFGLRTVIYTMDVQHRPWLLQNWELLLMLATLNCWFSIVLNPLLFSLMSTKFRTALKALWNTKMKGQQLRRENMHAV